ncbi:2',3'-cyclic-nucleotide 2'-phosphodiesterase [Volucribacter amazonae]|uniref:2',3'-cyclic-nucleotide 2'-phosphodiesterase/3'-nucleotidase n=1 Tax=Volucribacter amazonae TaxID=256731 RepID=A0A9X4PDG4_9PAST|nr:2',3'-cyclic-nucleotide 2'-phosphodiesterase [Volucribacter amazonae]MDG6895234.1 2',3'-cyclic-nucleotide 2'-phosphodiesterase [Volucribacter amazonae]
MNRRHFIKIGAGALLALNTSSFALANPQHQIHLRIIATTDIHGFLTDFDYYKDTPTDKFGFSRAASLIEQARKEVKNVLLVDNGDLIQGNPIADYYAAKGYPAKEKNPAISVLNQMQYDAGTLGNHEFNYGLDFLQNSIEQANFPIVNANVVKAGSNEPFFTPYVIQTKSVIDEQGQPQVIKVAYIGFVPPQIMVWDKAHLTGKVNALDIVQTAKKYIPQIKQQGADIIIALAHTGPSDEPYQEGAENSAFYLADIEGIDAVIFGHSHRLFPHTEFANSQKVNIEQGTVNHIPASMAGYWANNISVIDLQISQQNNQWVVTNGKAELRPIYDNAQHKATVENHSEITALLQPIHQATRDFVAQPIGFSQQNMYSYLALLQDDPTVQIVNLAQQDYVQNVIKNLPDLADIPVLSAAAPFKAGGRKNDPHGYTEVEKGQLSVRNAADLYLYPNTLVVVKVNGEQLKEWLECSAGMFNQIDPNTDKPQYLLNWQGFRTYNFDVIYGVNYQYDLTQPARYNGECQLINPNAQRVINLTFNGKAVNSNDEFLIATNNYRAYGNKFPGTGEQHIVYASPDENRQILINYISKVSQAQGSVQLTRNQNWRIVPIQSKTALDIRFETSPTEKAKAFIAQQAQYPMQFKMQDETGFAVYQVDLTK